MQQETIESKYPLSFRQDEAQELGKHLKTRHSVVLIGMKRVGISNFLRFFLSHKDIEKKYIKDTKKHFFIPVDLNDLVEKEVFPFWTLTHKRILDAVEVSGLSADTKKHLETLFLDSIQSQDLFLTIDNVRRSMMRLVEENLLPTLFYIRFDRMKDVVTPEFFGNLQGLKDATGRHMSYVFTSYRGLDDLAPQVFSKASLSVFSKNMFIKPAKTQDTRVIAETYTTHYKLTLSQELEQDIYDVVDGYIQYLQLALIGLHEQSDLPKDKIHLFEQLISDERITLQSEELLESLSKEEQEILEKLLKGEMISDNDKKKGQYLWDTGMVGEKNSLFSILFEHYLKERFKKEKGDGASVELSKKEHLLFKLLLENKDKLCEREQIIESVWAEVESLGVSDWAIDRLVARVRNKLKLQNNKYEIQTVKTRGYKLKDSR